MKTVISTLCGQMLARKEDKIFPPLLKILSQQEAWQEYLTLYEPPQKEEEIGLYALSTN